MTHIKILQKNDEWMGLFKSIKESTKYQFNNREQSIENHQFQLVKFQNILLLCKPSIFTNKYLQN